MTTASPNNHVPSQTPVSNNEALSQTLENALSIPPIAEEHLEITETIRISDYIQTVTAAPETVQAINARSKQQRESTRARLSILLVKFFGASLAGTFLMVLITIFQPDVDKAVVKDYVPLILTPQVTLLGVALGFYFGTKED